MGYKTNLARGFDKQMNHINNLTDFYLGLSDMQYERNTVIEQAITDIRKYQDRMSIDGRAIQHIADSLEKLIK